METFEKLGVFYLGRLYDMYGKKSRDELLLYDSRDLVTHAVCVGMTGSGKTGLCVTLIEEAAIDGVPAIVIDPKGDLSNLLLTFPQLKGEDFLPWINQEEARQKGVSPEDYAAQQAELWRSGLAGWGQSGERIQHLRDAADFVIYTPGSNAGIPVSILKSFAAPESAIREDGELMRERISTTVTSLLGLAGIAADPIQSREHILLSTIIDLAWRKGDDLDLASLIQEVQSPAFNKIGVLDLESFYPAKERFGLVMALNNLLASPSFSAWLEGEPLSIAELLFAPAGKPRIAVFSIAHLSDAERMFFVSLLLTQVLGWMRSQSGTTSLRALVYMDEIFGYLPPVANPPSKLPLLTLLKQARGFGIGIVLTTQNPVDLDYKALANAGTWFIGRLQTERDKARLLDGLEGAAVTAGTTFDRQHLEELLAGLGKRIFLMNNAHEDAPVVFQSRWALSYLRGPLTRDQIRILMKQKKAQVTEAVGAQPAAVGAGSISRTASLSAENASPPSLPPEITISSLPVRGSVPQGHSLVYHPKIIGGARLRLANARTGVDITRDVLFMTAITGEIIPVSWENAEEIDVPISELGSSLAKGARFAELPPVAAQAKNYADWSRDFSAWLYGTQEVVLLKIMSLAEVSVPGESERDFRIRLQQTAREQRDLAVERLRLKYAPKIVTLQDRIRRAQQVVEREAVQAKQAHFQTAVSFGATLLGAFMGRKTTSRSTMGRATTAARGIGRSMQQQQDISRAKDTVEALQQQLADLEAQFNAETAALESKIDPLTEQLERIVIRPKKVDISVQLIALLWAPYWIDEGGNAHRAW